MPLVSSGRGYADWQRVQNFDSDPVFQRLSVGIGTGVTTPVIDCSRWAYLAGLLFPQNTGTTGVTVTIQWFSDGLAANRVGQRVFCLDSFIGRWAQIRLPNLGPFFTLSFNSMGGNLTPIINLFLTNRVAQSEFLPVDSMLLDVVGATLPASGNVNFTVTNPWSGPVYFYCTATQGFTLEFDHLDVSAVYKRFYISTAQVANAVLVGEIVFPPDSVRLQVNNTGAVAGTATFNVIAPTTGST